MDEKNWSSDSESSPDEDQDKEERKSPSRLDRLMGAKDRAEKEAERWSEIEDLGLPVPSHDQTQPGMTQPLPPEPPRKRGDTPVGQDTPPEADDTPFPQVKPSGPSQKHPAPPFPHPTDPAPPPSMPEQQPPSPAQRDGGYFEEPSPPEISQQPRRSPGSVYKPPPDKSDTVRVDESGMPLPKRVPREDPNATIVGESAYRDDVILPPTDRTMPHGYERPDLDQTRPAQRQATPPMRPEPPPVQAYQPPPPPARTPQPQRPAPKPKKKRRTSRQRRPRFSWGCLLRAAGLSLVAGLVAIMLGGGGAAIYYAQITAPTFRGIREVTDLQARALQFQTTRIRDREGNILYQINDPEGGLRDYVTLDEVSPWVIVATVATEERAYFTNPGFSIYDITRAVVQNYREGRVVSGASTITQQLTRALLLPEEERTERTYQRKIKEIFLSAELGRRFTKQEVLELYLNQIYYGNLAYGIEAAAQTYFDKSARDLTLAEAAFLAGLPQAPAVWDPVTNKEATLERQRQVLALMLEAGCLDTGDTGLELPCVTDVEIVAAQQELAAIAAREFQAPALAARYPHWVVYIQQILEADPTIGPAIYNSGFDVYTTLDPRLQDLAQEQVEIALSGLTGRNVNNASVVVIDPKTGAILAMVGSRDFDNEVIDGQVNIALTPQQPGSSIKPFTYLAAFRKGWTPATVIWDVPIEYAIPGFGVYAPVNYDGEFRGPVSVREAIANSLNVPAVQTLDYVGVPGLLEVLNDVGITSLGDPSNPNNYGLSLTLGAGEVYLLEWANAFATIANGGVYRPTYAIERIELNGEIVEGYPYQVPEGEQVIDPAHAYLMQTILSDDEARVPSFGSQSPLSRPYPAGAKTGTTNDFRDNWTMGFTTEMTVGVWVGNTDNSPMVNVTGVTGAGPIWQGIMDGAQSWYPAQEFPRPAGLVFDQTVCKDDGAVPSQYCLEHSETFSEVFALNTPPPGPEESIYRELQIDGFTGLIANQYCPEYVEEGFFVFLPNPSQLIDVRPSIQAWLTGTEIGQNWLSRRRIDPNFVLAQPPEEECREDMPRPTLVFTDPAPGSEQSGMLIIRGSVDAPNFSHYKIEYGLGPDPQGWQVAQGETSQVITDGVLGQLDLSQFENGQVTLRLLVFDLSGHSAEARVVFTVNNPTPTPTPTPTASPTPTPTATNEPKPTVEPPATTEPAPTGEAPTATP